MEKRYYYDIGAGFKGGSLKDIFQKGSNRESNCLTIRVETGAIKIDFRKMADEFYRFTLEKAIQIFKENASERFNEVIKLCEETKELTEQVYEGTLDPTNQEWDNSRDNVRMRLGGSHFSIEGKMICLIICSLSNAQEYAGKVDSTTRYQGAANCLWVINEICEKLGARNPIDDFNPLDYPLAT